MALVQQWKTLYTQTLPKLAKARDPAQPKWPVTLDHCFARIILDNTIGQGSRQWDKVIKKPAIKNMTEQQFKDAIELGEKIENGEMNLEELDKISLMCRGKSEGKYGGREPARIVNASKKRKASERLESESKSQKRQSTLPFASTSPKKEASHFSSPPASDLDIKAATKSKDNIGYPATLARIRSSTITPYRKRLYTTLLSVPRGRYTTYAAMSDYLNSSARAVGNGMRNNPFAPDVPCHRVLAADGSLGGFKGDWGKEGKYAKSKIELLRSEGVRFDGKWKVVGEPFRKFHEFENLEDCR